MVGRIGQFELYFNKEEQEELVKKFRTTDKKELKKLIKEQSLNNSENSNESFLSAKERREEAQAQIAQAKANRIKDKESLLLRKLEAETELVERQLNYSNTFESNPSYQAKTAMKKGIEQKYYNHGQSNITETIQKKKNFYIEKQNYGYIGKCIICKNCETDLCSTGYEAERDIELHLELIHETGLYQR